jgi:hypothetical protein
MAVLKRSDASDHPPQPPIRLFVALEPVDSFRNERGGERFAPGDGTRLRTRATGQSSHAPTPSDDLDPTTWPSWTTRRTNHETEARHGQDCQGPPGKQAGLRPVGWRVLRSPASCCRGAASVPHSKPAWFPYGDPGRAPPSPHRLATTPTTPYFRSAGCGRAKILGVVVEMPRGAAARPVRGSHHQLGDRSLPETWSEIDPLPRMSACYCRIRVLFALLHLGKGYRAAASFGLAPRAAFALLAPHASLRVLPGSTWWRPRSASRSKNTMGQLT